MWQVSITVYPEMEEAVVRLLGETLQIPVVVYADARSGKNIISSYAPSLSARRRLCQVLNTKVRLLHSVHPAACLPAVAIKKVPRENWAESWKRHFKPIEIGGALLVKPGWSRRRPRPGQQVVVLDPGLSFGTGHHATTAFCLGQLAACRRQGERQSFLDIGTGSGILAIAAAKLGYAPVEAFDFDPESIRVSRENVKINRVEKLVAPCRLDLTRLPAKSRQKWDLICANLMADLLEREAGKIRARLKPGGQLIVAGILRREFRRIRDIFVTFRLTLVENQVNREWHSGRFVLLPEV